MEQQAAHIVVQGGGMTASGRRTAAVHVGVQSADIRRASGHEPAAAHTGWEVLLGGSSGYCLRHTLREKKLER